MKILDINTDFVDGDDPRTQAGIIKAQEIPEDFVSDLKKQKLESKNRREGEFMHFARIPVIVHEKWLREGFDCTRAPYKETQARLHREGLDAFIVTNKRI